MSNIEIRYSQGGLFGARTCNIKSIEHIISNIKIHNKIYDEYEQRHDEIYNPIEQERLSKKLKKAFDIISTDSKEKIALDYGCGTGNLTKHLIKLGSFVVSADISEKFLEVIKERYQFTGKSDTLKVNGYDLSNIENNKFDIVATYSVLHHVPDYLKIIKEMIRITRQGGIIYLDHEVNENYWYKNKDYSEFLRKVAPIHRKYLKYLNWKTFLKLPKYIINKIKNPRYQEEGDIHVFPDDHIEWDKIENLLIKDNCEVVLREDYLLYRGRYPIETYNKYKNICNDMRVLIAMKKGNA